MTSVATWSADRLSYPANLSRPFCKFMLRFPRQVLRWQRLLVWRAWRENETSAAIPFKPDLLPVIGWSVIILIHSVDGKASSSSSGRPAFFLAFLASASAFKALHSFKSTSMSDDEASSSSAAPPLEAQDFGWHRFQVTTAWNSPSRSFRGMPPAKELPADYQTMCVNLSKNDGSMVPDLGLPLPSSEGAVWIRILWCPLARNPGSACHQGHQGHVGRQMLKGRPPSPPMQACASRK